MEWQYWANRIAIGVKLCCLVSAVGEVEWAIRYHFPMWDNIAMPITLVVWMAAEFVDRHTRMYRIDT